MFISKFVLHLRCVQNLFFMKHTYDIRLLDGFGPLKFGQSIEQTINLFGDAEEIDHLDTDDQMITVVLHYWDRQASVFFEGVTKTVLSCVETDNPETTLFGHQIFDMTPNEVIALMKENGYSEPEIEEEEGETRITYEEVLIDFFFDGEYLLAANWGVLVNEAGEIVND